MKKTFIKILVFLIAFVVIVPRIYAYQESAITNGTAVRVCEYKDTENDVQLGIYYYFQYPQSSGTLGPWEIDYKRYNSLTILEDAFGSILTLGNFKSVFIGNNRISYNQDKNRFSASFENTFTCPKYGFIDYDWNNEICFGDYQTCGKNFEKGPYLLDVSTDNIFKIIDDYANTQISSDENATILRNGGDVSENIRKKVREYIVNKYSFGTTYTMPTFIDNYINTLKFDTSNSVISQQFEELKKQVKQQIESEVAKGTLTEEEAQKEIEKIENTKMEQVLSIVSSVTKDLNMRDDPNCNGLLGADMTVVVRNIITFVQYLGPVLVVVFSLMDFIKASVAGDDGQMKKAASKMMKRVVCGILLFFVPLICNTILDIGNISVPEICIKQYDAE